MSDADTTPLELTPGLLRWTAPHPGWDPDARPGSSGDWDPLVGSVLFEAGEVVALIDPLVPQQGRERFLGWLDERIAGCPVSILTTIHWHRRDRDELAERYRAQTLPRAWNAIPRGVELWPLSGAGEVFFWLPAAAALVAGDRLVAFPGEGLALCPESWLADVRVDRRTLAGLLGPLAELPIERVLVSHGEPVLHGGHAALVRAIAEVAGA